MILALIMKERRTYFPGLSALRFFAATLVIFHHLEQYKFWSNKESNWGHAFIDAMGHKPVGLFFVLSGFLITYLLLEEKRNKKSIKIGQFYWKRVLRIWPLYFVIVLIALFVIPSFSTISFEGLPSPKGIMVFLPLVFILPNLLRISFPTLIGGNQLWSVGIEEQFYLIWPILVKRFQGRIIPFLFTFIALKVLVHLILLIAIQINTATWLLKIETLYSLFPVEQMAVGGLGAAYLFHNKTKVVRYMGSRISAALALLLIIATSFFHINSFLNPLFEAVLFMLVIYQITSNTDIHKCLENNTLKYLGSISYGIYMWHTIAITISITMLDLLEWNSNLLLCSLSLIFTLLFAHLSFKYLESPIQGLRKYIFGNRSNIKLNTVANA